MSSASIPVLEMSHISKSFPGVQALTDLDFRLFPGEVHALMGQNGAGKSTLIKVMTGVYAPDSGTIRLEGQLVTPQSPAHSQRLGISPVFQEVNLCPNISVTENILLGWEPRFLGFVNWKEAHKKAREILKKTVGLDIDVHASLSSFSLAVQQLIAIARALSVSARVIIFDEPTSSLDDQEVQQFFKVIRDLKAQGMAIVFVTHFLEQTYEISDRITVLRNGAFVGEWMAADLPKTELIARMIGKDAEEVRKMEEKTSKTQALDQPQTPWLQVEGLGKKGWMDPFSLSVGSSENLGLVGLLGSGRTELAQLIFGLEKRDRGRIQIDGQLIEFSSPYQALQHQFAYLPENRKEQGLIETLSIRENLILALQVKQGIFKTLPRKKQETLAAEFVKILGIKTPDLETPIRNLSGGNQQKVILARWLATDPRFIILDEPTRGIDIAAKAEIEAFIQNLRTKGLSILFISSEWEETLRVSTRLVLLRDRQVISSLENEGIDMNDLMHAIAQGSPSQGDTSHD